jgi:hypothetical protein
VERLIIIWSSGLQHVTKHSLLPTKISVQLIVNMEGVFPKTLLLWKNDTKGTRVLTCCQITAGVLSGLCLRLITNISHQLKIFKTST